MNENEKNGGKQCGQLASMGDEAFAKDFAMDCRGCVCGVGHFFAPQILWWWPPPKKTISNQFFSCLPVRPYNTHHSTSNLFHLSQQINSPLFAFYTSLSIQFLIPHNTTTTPKIITPNKFTFHLLSITSTTLEALPPPYYHRFNIARVAQHAHHNHNGHQCK